MFLLLLAEGEAAERFTTEMECLETGGKCALNIFNFAVAHVKYFVWRDGERFTGGSEDFGRRLRAARFTGDGQAGEIWSEIESVEEGAQAIVPVRDDPQFVAPFKPREQRQQILVHAPAGGFSKFFVDAGE